MNIQAPINNGSASAPTLPKAIQIEMISDIICPWCVIGLRELELALGRLSNVMTATIHFRSYQLMPDMPREGRSLVDIYRTKFGKTFDEMAEHREASFSRAKNVGFAVNFTRETRINSTFDGHRLLHWADLSQKQVPLQHALFKAHFTDGKNISDENVLVDLASSVGLDGDEARKVLSEGRYADEVRASSLHWRQAGIKSVPAFLIDGKHLIPGGQTADVFEGMLQKLV